MAKYADVRFYGELRDFLVHDRIWGLVTRTFDVPGSVKDMIEACGVPHTEVDVILANGTPVDFTYRVQDGDRVSVYPQFRTLKVGPRLRAGAAPLREARFVADGHLGKLSRYLRLIGIDTRYEPDPGDLDLVQISVDEDRILLTRDVGLLMHGSLTHGYFVRSVHPEAQLDEVARRFDLAAAMQPFSRCMVCNGLLEGVTKDEIIDRLEPETSRHHDDFHRCPDCNRIYWQGSHADRLREIVASVRPPATGTESV